MSRVLMLALEIKNFTKRYGELVAVNNISFDIKQGEFFGFLGPNGAGKTTTISCITGIGAFTEGSISVFGIDVRHHYREARRKIGLSPQEFNVDFFAKVDKILDFMAGYYGMRKNERQKRVDEVVHILGLETHRDKPFRTLSGGLKRRVMLARAMVHDPDLLILDEPTAGVDVELRLELWEYLRMLNRRGKTILFTSHYLDEVEQLCNRIAIINHGQIVAIGDKSEFVGGGKKLEDRYLEITKYSNS